MLTNTQGFLFIGDPHIASTSPGRRKDADFAATVAGSLSEAFRLANRLCLQPVILGDLFHRERDSEARMLVHLFRALRLAERTPWCLVGNHDLEEHILTDRTTLAAVAETGLLQLIGNGAFDLIDCNGVLVGLGGTPYGQAIPQSVEGLFAETPDQAIWITHTDVRFKQAYPGALEPFAIAGCDLVVNGHMHLEQPSVQVGHTLWVNPGNITRVSVDALDYAPGVLAWTPLEGLRRYPIAHAPGVEVFNLQGRLSTADDAPNALAAGVAAISHRSDFVRMLVEDVQSRSGSGAAVLAAELEKVAEEERIAPEVLRLLFTLIPDASAETPLPAALPAQNLDHVA
ncbi:metallophosphoesterase family protein [Thiomonas sp.]